MAIAVARTSYDKCSRCGRPVFHKKRRFCRPCYFATYTKKRSTPLRRWRERTGKDLRWLSREIGVSYKTISRVAGGMKPSPAIAYAIHKATGIPLAELTRNV